MNDSVIKWYTSGKKILWSDENFKQNKPHKYKLQNNSVL